MATNNNLFENIAKSQKDMLDMWKSTTEKVKGTDFVSENLNKGNEMVNEWFKTQKEIFSSPNGSEKKSAMENTAKEATNMFQTWMNQQNEMVKNMYETAQKNMQNAAENVKAQMPTNPFASMMNNTNNPMMDAYTNWMSEMEKAYSSNGSKMVTPDMDKNIRSMFDNAKKFGWFTQMWAPFMESLNTKDFNPETFFKNLNLDAFKSFTDNMMSMAPEQFQTAYKTMMDNMNALNGKGTSQMNDMFNNMIGQINNMPFNSTALFSNLNNTVGNMFTNMENSFAPFQKLMPTDKSVIAIGEANELNKLMAMYSIRNNEMMAQMYQTSFEALTKHVNDVHAKMQEGTAVDSMESLYKNWLNTNDNFFVNLYESDAYTNAMSDLNAISLKMKTIINKQMERAMENIPVVTKSEINELYKTIHDLKNKVRDLSNATKTASSKVTATPVAKAKTATPKAATTKKATPAKKATTNKK